MTAGRQQEYENNMKKTGLQRDRGIMVFGHEDSIKKGMRASYDDSV
jgi:hypothetical protein